LKLGGDEALRTLGFKAPEISPNYSQTIEIEDVKDLTYAARFAFRVLKKVYRVSDFSSATFKVRVPSGVGTDPHLETTEPTAGKETVHELFMKKISGNPRFRAAKKSGKGFVIGGAKPPSKT
jgi:hypothetical protein